MANLITHSLSYSKESMQELFYKPLFVDSDLRDIVTLRLDIKNSEKLDFIDKLEKITKAYAKGSSFTASTGVAITQKTLSVSDMKAEVKQNGKAFLNWVKESLLASGYEENDIMKSEIFEEIVMSIFQAGIARDLERQMFFGDAQKEERAAGVPTGTLDADYKEYDGFWSRIIDAFDASTIPAAQYVDLNTATYVSTLGVKEVDTVTLTGTSGTANVNINGVDYLATFDTDLTTTAANFVTSHAATIAAREGKLVVTSSGADIIVTAGIAGMAQQDPTVSAAITGDLTGSNANTTANTSVGDLKTDAAKTMFAKMYAAMPAVLRGKRGDLRIMVTASIMDNYMETLENLNGSDAAYRTLLNGESVLAYRGIPIIERTAWDEHIADDFGGVRPHRALLTLPKNLVFGTDGISDDSKIELFYDQVEQENVFRIEYKAGTQYIHDEFIVAAY